jgi:hypothetical protein
MSGFTHISAGGLIGTFGPLDTSLPGGRISAEV